MTTLSQAAVIRCQKCGTEFGCDPLGACWCKDETYRVPMPASPADSCLCPTCLRDAANEKAG